MDSKKKDEELEELDDTLVMSRENSPMEVEGVADQLGDAEEASGTENEADKARRETGRGIGKKIVYYPTYFDNLPVNEVERLPTLNNDSVYKMPFTRDR